METERDEWTLKGSIAGAEFEKAVMRVRIRGNLMASVSALVMV
jgi:hypothetical protein